MKTFWNKSKRLIIKYWVSVPIIAVFVIALLALFIEISEKVLAAVSLLVVAWTFLIIFWDIKSRNRPFIYFETPQLSGAWILLSIKNCGTLKGKISRLFFRYLDNTSGDNEVVRHTVKEIDLYPNETYRDGFNLPRVYLDTFKLEAYIEYKTPSGESHNSYRSWKIEQPIKQIELDETKEDMVEGNEFIKVLLTTGERK